jgi:AraC family L-rhamnose operon transcriptional activator RhaR
MRRFRPLLIDRANLRVPGLRISTFAVHRHLSEHASVSPHRHPWCQAIVYLSGVGEQEIGGTRARVQPGTMVLLPPGVPHAFTRRSTQAPLCVLVDFQLRGARRRHAVVRSLNRSEVSQLQQHVATLLTLQTGKGNALRWEGAVPVLQVLLTLLRAAGWIERVVTPASPTANRAMASLLAAVSTAGSLTDTIRRSGYHRDHLNRLLKKEVGLTLGQYRAQVRLAKAKELLGSGLQVASVGAAVGLPDQGYFARWFRRQTGQTPSAWRRSGRVAATATAVG